jgi:acyl-CoA thioesterase-2
MIAFGVCHGIRPDPRGTMTTTLDGLLTALDLTDTGARTSEDIFTGVSQWMPHGRVFGGQVLAQSLVAAMRTTPQGRAVHSMHGYFLRPGDVNHNITFSVDRIHDGRSFSTRRTQAYQNGLPILSMIASFQDPSDGLEHQVEMPADVPAPEDLKSDTELLAGFDHPVGRYWRDERPFDLRHIPSPLYISVEGEHVAHQAVWFKTYDRLPDDPDLHRAALAYASDYTLLEPTMRRHGISWATPGLKIASLDHAMWFHRFGRVDEWLLYVQESPSATGGRGLSHARIYSREGMLVANVAQEGMLRLAGA